MRVTLAVGSETGDHTGATDDLYAWLREDPELRALVRREPPAGAPAGAMGGAWSELLTLLLAPGGPTAAVGAAVVVWLQNRRSNVTVTINQPDGSQVVISSEKVRSLTAEETGELARRVAAALEQRATAPESPEAAQAEEGATRRSGGAS
ncbi:effector-associated constant component EACC1 [Streptomyces eurythermus]|uniref:effector-associated constant component EACC1 n=1 Tax=Streptomyces eurythermus TaxID=42237 RepID=UPI0033C80825